MGLMDRKHGIWGESGDRLGSALSAGDFDGDGFDDLAIGIPYYDVKLFWGLWSVDDAGGVLIVYGHEDGLGGDRRFTMLTQMDWRDCESGDLFGFSLAAGHFDGDRGAGQTGFWLEDLAIGAPGEDTMGERDAGAVNVIYGSERGLVSPPRGGGLAVATFDAARRTDDSRIQEDARYGFTLAVGNFTVDPRSDSGACDDLAVGVPYYDHGPARDAGTVNVLYGSSHDGLNVAGEEWLDPVLWSSRAVTDGHFGESLAVGNFDVVMPMAGPIGFAEDLAIGAPGDGFGKVFVVISDPYGSARSLTESRRLRPYQPDPLERKYGYGSTLVAGNFYRSDPTVGADDLAIGIPGAVVDGKASTGAVDVLYSKPYEPFGHTGWHLDEDSLGGRSEEGDYWGGREGGIPWYL